MKNCIFLLGLVVVVACAPMSYAPTVSSELAEKEAEIQREIALKDTRENFERLQRIADPILLANANICGKKIAPYYGITFSSLDLAPKEYQGTMQRLYGIKNQPTIYHVSKQSPALEKLKMADMILKINGTKIKSGRAGVVQIDSFTNDEAEIDKISTITIDRAGVVKDIPVQPKVACKGKAVVQEDTQVNAYADGSNIVVTSGMMDFAKSDAELALVVGHELAHNSRKHVESKQGNAFIGMLFGAVLTGVTGVNVMGLGSDIGALAFSQGFEAEADYVGLYHTSRAGYNIQNAPNFWRRMGAKNPAGIHLAGTSHPSTAKRFIALEQAVKEINTKKANKQKLVPEEKDQKEFKKDVGDINS